MNGKIDRQQFLDNWYEDEETTFNHNVAIAQVLKLDEVTLQNGFTSTRVFPGNDDIIFVLNIDRYTVEMHLTNTIAFEFCEHETTRDSGTNLDLDTMISKLVTIGAQIKQKMNKNYV